MNDDDVLRLQRQVANHEKRIKELELQLTELERKLFKLQQPIQPPLPVAPQAKS